jgi:endonuclease/exonuclease/phosphatase family metal-dependent hydrolase
LLVLNILLIIATVLAYISPLVHPSENRIPGIMGLFFPILFFLNLFAILFWLSFGRWYAILSMICLIGGYQRIQNFIQLGIHQTDDHDQVVRIGTYNVFSFHKVSQSEDRVKRTFEQIVKELGNPDLICLQESVYIGWHGQSPKDYPHVFLVPGSGTVILSKFRIVGQGQIKFEQVQSLSGWVDVVIGQGTVRVFGLHLMSNRITEESEQLLEEVKIRDGRTWVMAGGLVKKYSAASARRATQADVIRQQIDASPYPTIVVGDFNDTPQSYAYETLRGSHLKDSFVARGSGIGTTYGGSIPGLRFDYVLADSAFSITAHHVLKLPYSDHYAVVAECVLR